MLSLEHSREIYASTSAVIPTAEQTFHSEMMAVISAIEKRPRFDLLKRFIAHGSQLPSRDKKFQNTKGCLEDDELAACVNFITGHMVSKFQGKLAEILASARVVELAADLVRSGKLPPDGSLVFGGAIRCLPSNRSEGHEFEDGLRGCEGPDAIYSTNLSGDAAEISLVAEVKSYPVSVARLRAQSDGHLRALRRGAIVQGRAQRDIRFSRGGPFRVFVQPSNWQLTRSFRLNTDPNNVSQIVMDKQKLPEMQTKVTEPSHCDDEISIKLVWSHDALRAAAFQLMHSYMGEVGKALAADPDERFRKDMSPSEAGENDFLAQLHVAISRQQEAESDAMRRDKTLELYNVLGFGWALGHGFRDKDGQPSMMFREDLRKTGAC